MLLSFVQRRQLSPSPSCWSGIGCFLVPVRVKGDVAKALFYWNLQKRATRPGPGPEYPHGAPRQGRDHAKMPSMLPKAARKAPEMARKPRRKFVKQTKNELAPGRLLSKATLDRETRQIVNALTFYFSMVKRLGPSALVD